MVYEAFQAKKFFIVLALLCVALSALGFIATGAIPELYQSLAERGIPVDLSIFQKDREL